MACYKKNANDILIPWTVHHYARDRQQSRGPSRYWYMFRLTRHCRLREHTDGKTDPLLSLDVLDAIGRTNYAEYFVDTVDNVPEIACSVNDLVGCPKNLHNSR